MGRKRPSAGGGSSRKSKKKKKKASKSKHAQDWYDSESEVPTLASAETRTKPLATSAIIDDIPNPNPDPNPNPVPSAAAEEDSEGSSDEEEPAPYETLLSSLIRDQALPQEHLDVLNRVRGEQLGVEELTVEAGEAEEDEESSDQDSDTNQSSTAVRAPKIPEVSAAAEDDNPNIDSTFRHRFCDLYGFKGKLEALTAQLATVETRSETVRLGKFGGLVVSREVKGLTLTSEEAVAAEGLKAEVKERLRKRWKAYVEQRQETEKSRGYAKKMVGRDEFGLTKVQRYLLKSFGSYRDTFFMDKSLENGARVREVTVLHVLNHLMKSCDLQAKHASRLKAAKLQAKQRSQEAQVRKHMGEVGQVDMETAEVQPDQGFTRPKVLVMLPTRRAALDFMRLVFELMPLGTQVANKGRFYQEFCTEVDESSKTGKAVIKREQLPASTGYQEDDLVHGTHPLLAEDKQRYKGAKARPLDYLQTFGGNKGEAFRLGVSMLGRKSIKLFADFYTSDLIVASPLGVRLAAELDVDADFSDQEEDDGAEEEVEQDHALAELGYRSNGRGKPRQERKNSAKDFLSSIEMLVVDDADVLLMQNWQHLVDVVNALNLKPAKLRTDTDFARVREYFLEEMAANFRQTIVLSRHCSPFINGLEPKDPERTNCAGVSKIRRATYAPELSQVEHAVPLSFVRIRATDRMSASDALFEHFREKVIPAFKRAASSGTLLFVPSYFDYVRVRNALSEVAIELGQEYDSSKKSKNRPRGRDGKRIARSKLDPFSNQSALFCCLSEYSEPSTISRVRGDFFKRKARVLVVTERFYFYYRYVLRGVARIVFYSPPTQQKFYSELVNLVDVNGKSKVAMLYTKYDGMALERIVGTELVHKMLSSDKDTYSITLDEG